MQLLAFNGGGYSIKKWLPPVAIEHYRHNWNFQRAAKFAESIDSPTIGVGFSRGATALSHMPAFTPHIKHAFLHSPRFDQPLVNPDCYYHVFVTFGDSTPVADDATRLFHWLAAHGATCGIRHLPFREFDNPTWFERYMGWKRHVFHNLVPVLREHGATRRFYDSNQSRTTDATATSRWRPISSR